MKQKYAIIRDDDQKSVVIREYAELDKEMMSLLCEETYSQETMTAAVNAGRNAVINAIRTNNMYPPSMFSEQIADAIIGLFADGGNLSAELFFDDKDFFLREAGVKEDSEEEENVEEDVDVDDLLDDDLDEDFDDGNEVLKDLKSSLQVADDDVPDIEEGA